MRSIAITGGIGSGKSTVSQLLRQQGYPVFDCDAISKEVTAAGSPLLKCLAGVLGYDIIKEDGSMDRSLVADIAFSDPDKYRQMTMLIQSAIRQRLLEQLRCKEQEGSSLVFTEVPLLYEAGWQSLFDEVWLVTAEEQLRIDRVRRRSGLSEEQIRARMAKQLSQEEKESLADRILSNENGVEELSRQVEEALSLIALNDQQ